jgi:hypothetical protein
MVEEPLFFTQMKENLQMKMNTILDESSISNDKIYKMVVVVRKDLKMGEGKIAAQVGHGGIN